MHLNISKFTALMLVQFYFSSQSFIYNNEKESGLGDLGHLFQRHDGCGWRWSVIKSLYYLIKDQNCIQDWDIACCSTVSFWISLMMKNNNNSGVSPPSCHSYPFIIYIFCLYIVILAICKVYISQFPLRNTI